MEPQDGSNPSLLSEILAGAVAMLAAISGYIANQVMGDSKRMYGIQQELHDLHAEADRTHAELFRRIKRIENHLFMTHNGRNER